jgi:hypothetical protein
VTYACVVEGKAEYYCIPSLLGRRGHTVIGILDVKGGNSEELPWVSLIQTRVFPRVRGMALKQPDRVLVVLDREGRTDCSPTLAAQAVTLLRGALQTENIFCTLRVVVCDRKFENAIFADVQLVDRLQILRPDQKFSTLAAPNIDGTNVIGNLKNCLGEGESYDKVTHGLALVQKLDYDNPQILQRSRCLRKLISEM